MKRFLHAHATHPDPHMALALAAAQIEAQRHASGMGAPSLGWAYLAEAYVPQAEALLEELQQRWPSVAWVGASAPGICAEGVEYFEDEPALALMLAELPREQFRVFSGRQPLAGWRPEAALVHADGDTPELQELLAELAGQTAQGHLFGGLAVGHEDAVQIAQGIWRGGLSGVAFGPGVQLRTQLSQGCQALGPERRITACEGQLLLELDGRPALDCLLQDLALPVTAGGTALREALPRLRRTLVGLSQAGSRGRSEYGPEVLVRHLIGLDPARRAVGLAERVEPGMSLSFCERQPEAARRDLLRMGTALRAEAEEEGLRMLGAVYISCAGRGGPHFGSASAELQWLRHGLGELPLVGFFAGGEIAPQGRLHGFTGVLTVFLDR